MKESAWRLVGVTSHDTRNPLEYSSRLILRPHRVKPRGKGAFLEGRLAPTLFEYQILGCAKKSISVLRVSAYNCDRKRGRLTARILADAKPQSLFRRRLQEVGSPGEMAKRAWKDE